MSEMIILASASPRRQSILTGLKLPFRVVIPRVREEEFHCPQVEELVRILAEAKVADVRDRLPPGECRWVVGVDTLVASGGRPMGKPGDADQARQMLESLAGNVHQVYSGIALLPEAGREICSRVVVSEVKFREMAPDEIDFYLSTGEWKGVAGGYRIQERAAFFIEWIKGSYSNIVGLPISDFYVMLRQNNYYLKDKV